MILNDTRRIDEAETLYRRAIALRERLVADFPSTPRYRQSLARNLAGLASLLGTTDRYREAEQPLRRALSIEDELAAEHPKIPDYRKEAADFLNNLGLLLAKAEQLDQAEQTLHRVVELRVELMNLYGGETPEYRSRTAITLHDLADVLCRRGKYDEARSLAERAIALHQAALYSSEGEVMYLDRLRGDHVLLAETLLSLGETAKASKAAEAAIAIVPNAWESFYYVAAAWSRCVPRIERNPKLDGFQRRALVRSVGDRAVDLLRLAIKKGYAGTAKSLQDDPDLQSLRPFDSFQRLIQELDKK